MIQKNKADKEKIIVLIGVILFILSLIPILYVAGYDHASGDDYGFGAITKQAWLSSHSLTAVIAAACEKVHEVYYTWQGTWLSVFLFTLQPEVFSFHAYWVVPYIMLSILIISVLLFFRHFMKKGNRLTGGPAVLIGLAVLFIIIQFVPDKRFAYYWWNGAIHYTVPFSLGLLSVASADRFLEKGRVRDLLALLVLQTMLGGMSYPAAVMTPVAIFFLCLYYYYVNGGTSHMGARVLKRAAFFLIPAMAELIGLYISAKAPGNKVRGGADFGFSLSYAVQVICNCFKSALLTGFGFIKTYPLLIVLAVLFEALLLFLLRSGSAGGSGNVLPEGSAGGSGNVLPDGSAGGHGNVLPDGSAGGAARRKVHPAVIAAGLYLIFASGFAPELYAAVSVSEGVGNTYFFTFVIVTCVFLLYTTEYVLHRASGNAAKKARPDQLAKSAGISGSKIAVAFLLFAVLLVAAFICRRNIKLTADYICFSYVADGRADRFKSEIELQDRLLTQSDEADVILPMTNGYDGPIMHMPIVEDPTAWTNEKTAQFYGKNSVTGMKPEEWNETYGTE